MNESPVQSPLPDKGVFARALGIIVSPTETFQSVVQAPRPAIILLLVCAVLLVATVAPQLTDHGREMLRDTVLQQASQQGTQELTPDAVSRIETFSRYTPYFTAAGIFIGVPIVSLLFTALYWVAFNSVMGGTATFKQVLGVVTHSQVIGALGALVAAPVALFQTTPPSPFGPFNLGALLPMLEPQAWLARFLGSITIFQIWGVIVTAIGLGVLYHRKARNIALTLLVLYVGVMAGLTSVSGLFRR